MCRWDGWYALQHWLSWSSWCIGIALITFAGFHRVKSFPAVYPARLKQIPSKQHEPSPRVDSRGRDRPNDGTMLYSVVAKFRRQGQKIRSLHLCVGERSKASLGEEANGGVGRTSAILNVVVTGANRGLGFAVADQMARLGHRVVLACRSESEGRAALERLRSQDRAIFHRLDVTCDRSLDSFRETCVNGTLGGKVDVLFNNAAVCLTGSDSSVLEETLAVNFYGALGVMGACLPAMAETTSVGPTVVWVSSGEGELCFLSSKWQELLGRAESVEEIKSHFSNLLASSVDARDGSHNAALPSYDAIDEIAFGPTPAYSLSKASANAVVRAWAPELTAERGVRLVAVCPGDVLTGMMSEEELKRGTGVSPEEAALDVVDVALRAADFPAGRFYRAGKKIGW